MLFSPFDALGLSWGLYNAGDIKQAYRRASLVCHPDKRSFEPDRWPKMHHLTEAREFLKDDKSDLNQFKDFPQTFFPQKEPYFRNPQPLPCHFKHCDICQVVVLSGNLNEHLGEHQQAVCPECNKRTHLDEINEHLKTAHGYQTCRLCHALTPADCNDHIANYHHCPLCGAEEAFLIHHLKKAHQLRTCRNCGGNNPVTHIITTHPTTECPGCDSKIFDAVLLDHLQNEHDLVPCHRCRSSDTATNLMDHIEKHHGFDYCPFCTVSFLGTYLLEAHLGRVHNIQPCESCPQGAFFDLDHITNHDLEDCQECDTTIESGRFHIHLVTHHKWVLCDICSSASPNKQALQEHKECHPVCKICDKQMTQERLQGHLQTTHRLLCCPLCDNAFSPADLPRHFLTAHNQTEPCSECQYTGTKVGLKEHVIEFHGWLQCRFCEEVFHDIGSKTKHEEDVHGTKPCWHCDQVIPEGQMRSHQIKEHGYKACPLCPSLSKELSSHIETHQQNPAHQQLSAINSQLKQFAALETPSKALLNQAVKLIEQAFHESHENNQNSNRNPEVFAPSQSAQYIQTQATIPSSTQTQQPSFGNEAGKPSVKFPHQGPGEKSSLTQSSRQRGCKRAPSSLESLSLPRKKVKTPVLKKTSLNDVLEKATCKETVKGFLEAVESDNHPPGPPQLQEPTSQSAYKSISLISQFADKCELKASRGKLRYYYALLQMAQLLERTRDGRQRVDSAKLDTILEHKRCEASEYNRNKLRNQLQLGRKLCRR
ncbi:hypothetical protein LZ32DRAFT_652429 [Colletotrichum eremochloae]|nr:hypothetical protein LZ32DRAFT_652429 [Colletotrichum eremochloae]